MATFKTLILVILCVKSFAQLNSINSKPKKQQQAFPGVCQSACQQGIDEAVEYAATLNERQTANSDKMLKRIIDLETEFYATIGGINVISQQLSNLEKYLTKNISKLSNRINEEARAVLDIATVEVDLVRGDLTKRLNDLTSEVNRLKNSKPTPAPNNPGNGNNGNKAMEVYYNLTRRIDNLEFDKIANLTADNNIWRKNFRVVNSTFDKMKQCSCMK